METFFLQTFFFIDLNQWEPMWIGVNLCEPMWTDACEPMWTDAGEPMWTGVKNM